MGYPGSATLSLLAPQYWGNRTIPVASLPLSPASKGYAAVTGEWPLEFNQPSSVVANTHTWSYAGYLNYSRGLPIYQANALPRKLSADFQSTTLWGGRLSVTGVNNQGEVVMLGPERNALTAQFYQQVQPTINPANQQVYEKQDIVEFPGQVVVYSTDNISSQFDGSKTTFNLLRGGLVIPSDQLSTESVFAILGATTQKPFTNYSVTNNQITFTDAPLSGTTCDIRVVTSEDGEKTLIVVPLTLSPAFDGGTTVFVATSATALGTTVIDDNNTFMFLGGVEQVPGLSYSISRVSGSDTFQVVFNEAPKSGTTLEIRAVCTALYWSSRKAYPVEVYSIDDLSLQFNGAKTDFNLTKNGDTINSAVVNTQNLFVSLGGAMQLPTQAYSVQGSKIVFTEAPTAGTSSNLRIVTNAEFITCPQFGFADSFLRWGPGLLLSVANELIAIDPGSLAP
jgi:hypothetical protein